MHFSACCDGSNIATLQEVIDYGTYGSDDETVALFSQKLSTPDVVS